MTSQCSAQLWFIMTSQHISHSKFIYQQTKRVQHAYLLSGPMEPVTEISFIPLNKIVPIMEVKMGSYNCSGFNVRKIPAIKELLKTLCEVNAKNREFALPDQN